MVIAVIPAYDEAETIAEVVAGARRFTDRVIVVDDGSNDRTGSLAADAGAHVVRHEENAGPGAATRTGIVRAREMGATRVVTLDGDGQHDPCDIPALLEPLDQDRADIVFANRFGRPNEIPRTRRFLNRCANIVSFVATGAWVADSQCGFKAFGPKALGELEIAADGFEFCTQIVRETKRHGWRMAEVPGNVRYSAKTLAKGQSFAEGIRTALATLKAVGRELGKPRRR
jgi:dolichol-phosphate mannosyltransferase